ncbi:MAG: hypothetical protein NC541_04005 [bacterium]|nr:hypothetical protein [bacterium]
MNGKCCILAKKVIYGSALAFLLFLSVTSFIYSSDGYEIRKNNVEKVLQDLAGVVLLLGIVWILSCLWEKMSKVFRIIVISVFFLTAMFFSAWWIVNSANLPQSDAKAIYDIAYRAKNHDLLAIAPTGSYMSLWPFQSGLVLFFETIFRLLPGADEMTVQWVYLPFMALSLIAGYMVVRKMFISSRTRFFWCVLMLLCIPYYLYVNNMYGEVPSTALMLFALWMFLEYSKKPSRYYTLLLGGGRTGGSSGAQEKYSYFCDCGYSCMGGIIGGKTSYPVSCDYVGDDAFGRSRDHYTAKVL